MPLGEEIEFVRDYLALESLRLGKRLRVDWELDPATFADEIPPLSLQPLVENAIQHGIAPRVDGGTRAHRSARNAPTHGLALSVRRRRRRLRAGRSTTAPATLAASA